MQNGPLEGVRITEFTTAWAGPYATCLLALLGAEVIKVESRRRLDHSRNLSFSTGIKFSGPDESSVFNTLNLNKLGITLNLKKPEAVELAKRIIRVSDATIENMRPGVMARLGLGYEDVSQVKPDIVYLSSSACGQQGPASRYVGYAPTFAALGGASHITGYEDWPPSNFMGSIDLRSASTSAAAILTALLYRQRTGEGQYIDLASQETISVLIGDVLLTHIMTGRIPMRQGNRDETMAPHNCYPCRGQDNWISIAIGTDDEWQALCKAMGKPELARDERFSAARNRWGNQAALDQIISEWTRNQEACEVMGKLQEVGVAAAPSLSSEGLFHDPHLRERGVFMQVQHPVLGNDWVIAPPWRLSATPATVRRHGPLLGEHNEYVFGELLGMSREEIQRLEKEEVIY